MKTITIQPTKNSTTEIIRCTVWFVLLIGPLLLTAHLADDNKTIFHLLLFLTGWSCWTFTEYCMHRFADHGEQYQKGDKPEKLHHYHHHHPTEIAISPLQRTGLLMLCALLITLSIWLDDYFTLIPGFVMGFTSYTFIHWFLHHKLSARIFPELHRFHIHHHCKHPDKCFGVTVTWWDHLFGTIPINHTEITERILAFYYKKEKDPEAKVVYLNNSIDAKDQETEKQSA